MYGGFEVGLLRMNLEHGDLHQPVAPNSTGCGRRRMKVGVAMSEPSFPTEGWWYFKKRRHNRVSITRVTRESDSIMRDGRRYPIWNYEEGEYLSLVPSAEAVQAAVEAMRKAAFLLEAYGDHAVTLRKAIAGLTCGEG